jgi:hypothetical protein
MNFVVTFCHIYHSSHKTLPYQTPSSNNPSKYCPSFTQKRKKKNYCWCNIIQYTVLHVKSPTCPSLCILYNMPVWSAGMHTFGATIVPITDSVTPVDFQLFFRTKVTCFVFSLALAYCLWSKSTELWPQMSPLVFTFLVRAHWWKWYLVFFFSKECLRNKLSSTSSPNIHTFWSESLYTYLNTKTNFRWYNLSLLSIHWGHIFLHRILVDIAQWIDNWIKCHLWPMLSNYFNEWSSIS